MTATASAARTASPGVTPRVQPVSRALLGNALRATVLWWAVPVTALAALVVARPSWVEGLEFSLWQLALHPPGAVSLALGAATAAIHLPLFVSSGVDRRRVFRGAALAHLPGVVVGGALAAGGFAVENATLVPRGLEPGLFDPRHIFDATDQYLLVAGEITTAMVTGWVIGWLVAVVFYRLGWWRGLAPALAALLVPALVVGALLLGWTVAGVDLTAIPNGVRVLLALTAIAAVHPLAEQITAGTELRGTSTWMVTG